jgi:hypothetical protein
MESGPSPVGLRQGLRLAGRGGEDRPGGRWVGGGGGGGGGGGPPRRRVRPAYYLLTFPFYLPSMQQLP